jgi:polar amino acid transport system substrate-binding protein
MQAMGTPKGRLAGAAFLRAYVEDVKAKGFVVDAITRAGQTAMVAPPAR